MAAKEIKRAAFGQSKSMGMFIEQVALKCFHQRQSMLAATPHLPKTEMKMKALSRGSQARKTTGTGRSVAKHLSLPKMVPEWLHSLPDTARH